MIKKIIKIQNVGKFKDCNPGNNTRLKGVTLIYAENKRGKSTFADILRSLSKLRSSIISGRKTRGASGKQEIKLDIDGNCHEFKQNNWCCDEVANLEVFDEVFVNRNVITGYDITSDHKKNLHSFVASESGDLIEEIGKLKGEKKDLQTEKRDLESFSVQVNGHEYSLSSFTDNLDVELYNSIKERAQTEIMASIKSLATKLQKIKDKEQIKEAKLFKKLKPIDLDLNEDKEKTIKEYLLEELNKQIDLDETLLTRVKEHFNSFHNKQKAESWFRTGSQSIEGFDESCPFCAQKIRTDSAKSRVEDLLKYFDSNKYEIKKKSLQKILEKLEQFPTQLINSNAVLYEKQKKDLVFWKTYIIKLSSPEDLISFDLDSVKKITGLINNKLGALPGALTKEAQNSIDNWCTDIEEYNEKVKQYNEWIDDSNLKINQLKEETTKQKFQIPSVQKEINLYTFLNKLKLEKELDKIKEYIDVSNKIESFEKEISEEKIKLQDQLIETHQKYGKHINKELERFSSDVQIAEVKSEYKGSGQKPFTEYKLEMLGESVYMDPIEGRFSVRNAFSTSDKRTLALCFFLAKIRMDPNLDKKIIVFDDPASSYDTHNSDIICKLLVEIAKKAKQLIVLTHDLNFAIEFDKHAKINFEKYISLKIHRKNKIYSDIREYNIDETLADKYYSEYESLIAYLENDVQGEIAQYVARGVLEKYLKIKFPQYFVKRKNLGGMIGLLKSYDCPKGLADFKKKSLNDLEDFNNYFPEKGHGIVNPQVPEDTKLFNKVKKLINFIQQ